MSGHVTVVGLVDFQAFKMIVAFISGLVLAGALAIAIHFDTFAFVACDLMLRVENWFVSAFLLLFLSSSNAVESFSDRQDFVALIGPRPFPRKPPDKCSDSDSTLRRVQVLFDC